MPSKCIKCGFLTVLLFAIGIFQACITPVPLPTRTSAPPSLKNKIDSQFIAIGHSTRQQVQEKLGWSAVDFGEEKVFWGRWSTSSSAIVWAIGGGYSGAVGGNRRWSIKNILIVFDDEGVVQSSRIVSDHDIVQAVSSLLTTDPRRFETTVELKLDHLAWNSSTVTPVTLRLSRTEIEYDEPDANKGKGCVFPISPQKLTAVTIPSLRTDSENPGKIWFTLHFSDKTMAGKNVKFSADPEDLATLLRYHEAVSQSGASKHK